MIRIVRTIALVFVLMLVPNFLLQPVAALMIWLAASVQASLFRG